MPFLFEFLWLVFATSVNVMSTGGPVAIGGRGIRVTRTFKLFVLGFIYLFFMAMLSIVSLLMKERMTVMRMKMMFWTVVM